MIEFEKFSFKNAVTYGNDLVTIPLKNEGAVYVGGVNGSGKSFGYNVFFNVLFGYTPLSSKGKRKLIANKNYYAEVNFNSEGKKHTIKQFFDNDEFKIEPWWGNGYDILENGKSLKIAGGIPECEKRIASLLPFTADEFCGFYYLTQDNMHVLVNGKGSERLAYLSQVFGLDIYDRIRVKLKKKLDGVDLELVGVIKAKEEMDFLDIELKKYSSLETLNDKIVLCEKDLKKVRSNKEILIKNKDDAENKKSTLKRRVELSESIKKYGKLRPLKDVVSEIENIHTRRDSYSVILNDWRAKKGLLDKYTEDLKKYVNKSLEKIKKELDSFIEKKGKADKCNEDVSLREVENKRLGIHTGIIKQCSYTESDLKVLFKENEKSIIEKRAERTKNVDLLAELRDLKGDAGICSRCGQKLNAKHIEEEIKRLVEDINKAKDLIDLTGAKNESYEQYLTAYKEISECETRISCISYKGKKIDIDKLDSSISELKDMLEKTEEAIRLKTELSEYDHVSVDDFKKAITDLKNVDTEFSALQKELGNVKEKNILEKELSKLPEVSLTEDWEAKIQVFKEKLDKIETMIISLIEDKKEAESNKVHVSSLLARKDRYLKTISKLDGLNRSRKIINSCYKAYAPANLKKKEIVKITDLIAEKLNIFVPLIFNENIEFKADPSGTNSIDILFQRDNQPARDVRFLNGGFKKRFLIALIPTLAGLVSVSKRSNIIILDEIDANVDQQGRDAIGEFLIPYLKTKFKTVIVISPSSYQDGQLTAPIPLDHFDKIMLAEYKNGSSSLREIKN